MASVNDIVGNYRLVAKLACGSFGCVYRSEHHILKNRVVAIKVMHNAHLNSQKEQDLFLEEARLLELLTHPHILPIIDVGVHEGFPYLVTEYAPNGSLLDRLKREPGKPLTLEEATTILTQIGQALQHAHEQGVVHRDLKPENILFRANGEVLLADFGIAKCWPPSGFEKARSLARLPIWPPSSSRAQPARRATNVRWDVLPMNCLRARDRFTLLIWSPICSSILWKLLSPHDHSIRKCPPTSSRPFSRRWPKSGRSGTLTWLLLLLLSIPLPLPRQVSLLYSRHELPISLKQPLLPGQRLCHGHALLRRDRLLIAQCSVGHRH